MGTRPGSAGLASLSPSPSPGLRRGLLTANRSSENFEKSHPKGFSNICYERKVLVLHYQLRLPGRL